MLRCLIVDDEPVAQGIIERYINEHDQLILTGKCNDALKANEFLQKGEVDLMFLDIEMPKLNGIDFLSILTQRPKVIITTAYREYAIQGFDLEVSDYLLKPISFERFVKAINRVLNTTVDDSQSAIEDQDYIYIKADKKMVQVFLKEVQYIEGLSNYVRIFLSRGKPIISYQKLSYLEDVLPSSDFVRCHRSYIASCHHIESYSNSILEIGGKEIPIGGNYRDDTLKRLKPFEA